MGVMFTASSKAVAMTAAQDLIQLKAAATGAVKIHGWCVSQSTEVGDAAEEMLVLTTNKGIGSVTDGSGGSSVTAVPLVHGATAFGGTVEANNTTRLAVGSGTLVECEVHSWNERVPYMMWYTPETRPVVRPSEYWTLEQETTPADSVTVSVTIWFEVEGI